MEISTPVNMGSVDNFLQTEVSKVESFIDNLEEENELHESATAVRSLMESSIASLSAEEKEALALTLKTNMEEPQQESDDLSTSISALTSATSQESLQYPEYIIIANRRKISQKSDEIIRALRLARASFLLGSATVVAGGGLPGAAIAGFLLGNFMTTYKDDVLDNLVELQELVYTLPVDMRGIGAVITSPQPYTAGVPLSVAISIKMPSLSMPGPRRRGSPTYNKVKFVNEKMSELSNIAGKIFDAIDKTSNFLNVPVLTKNRVYKFLSQLSQPIQVNIPNEPAKVIEAAPIADRLTLRILEGYIGYSLGVSPTSSSSSLTISLTPALNTTPRIRFSIVYNDQFINNNTYYHDPIYVERGETQEAPLPSTPSFSAPLSLRPRIQNANCTIEESVSVDPRGTYLTVSPRDRPNPPSFLSLAPSISGQDFIQVKGEGNWRGSPTGGETAWGGIVGVFGLSKDNLLYQGFFSRAFGFVTANSYDGEGKESIPTDIPEDFSINWYMEKYTGAVQRV